MLEPGSKESGELCAQCGSPKSFCMCPKASTEAQSGDQGTASNEKYPRPGSPEAEELIRLHGEFYDKHGFTPEKGGLEQLAYDWKKHEELGTPDLLRRHGDFEDPNSTQKRLDREFFQTPEAIAEFKKHGWTLPKI